MLPLLTSSQILLPRLLGARSKDTDTSANVLQALQRILVLHSTMYTHQATTRLTCIQPSSSFLPVLPAKQSHITVAGTSVFVTSSCACAQVHKYVLFTLLAFYQVLLACCLLLLLRWQASIGVLLLAFSHQALRHSDFSTPSGNQGAQKKGVAAF